MNTLNFPHFAFSNPLTINVISPLISLDICISLSYPQNSFNSFINLYSLSGDSNIIVVFSLLLISERILFLSDFFFGRNPSNTKREEGIPLTASAVSAAQGPGMQMVSISFDFVS